MTWKDVVEEVRTTNPSITKRHEMLSCFLSKNKRSPGIFIDELSTHFILSPEKEEKDRKQRFKKQYSFESLVTFLQEPKPENFWCDVKEIVGDYLEAIGKLIYELSPISDFKECISNALTAFRSSKDNHTHHLLRFCVVIKYSVGIWFSSYRDNKIDDLLSDCHQWKRGQQLIDTLKGNIYILG